MQGARKHTEGYWLLLCFTIFNAFYVTVLYMQSDAHTTYLVASAHNSVLTPDYTPDGSNTFSSTNDVLNWLNTSIIQPVWVDVSQTCGNGLCDYLVEYQAFGPDNRFGCEADCGSFPKTTMVTVNIGTSFSSKGDQANSSWNICFADGNRQCWFETDQTFSGALDSTQSLSLELPDANYTLKLNAPNGGLGIILTSENGTKLLEVGYGCDVIPDLDSRSNYTICRQNCTNYFNACGSRRGVCLPSFMLGAKPDYATVIYWFNRCLQNCTTNAALSTSQNVFALLNPAKCAYDETASLKLNAPNLCNKSVGLEVDGDYYISGFGATGTATGTISPYPTGTPATLKTTLWDKLGATDNDRLGKLAAAVMRMLFSMTKDECLVKDAKALSSGGPLTHFLCLFFGGPTKYCPYSTFNGSETVTDEALLNSMQSAHVQYG